MARPADAGRSRPGAGGAVAGDDPALPDVQRSRAVRAARPAHVASADFATIGHGVGTDPRRGRKRCLTPIIGVLAQPRETRVTAVVTSVRIACRSATVACRCLTPGFALARAVRRLRAA